MTDNPPFPEVARRTRRLLQFTKLAKLTIRWMIQRIYSNGKWIALIVYTGSLKWNKTVTQPEFVTKDEELRSIVGLQLSRPF